MNDININPASPVRDGAARDRTLVHVEAAGKGGKEIMGWAERLNPNSERNIDRFDDAAKRDKHREENEKRTREEESGDAAAHRSPLYAYGRAVLRDAKMRRRAEKIALAAAKLEASSKRAKEAEGADASDH